MDPGYNRFGIGYVQTPGSQYTHYWTQALGTSSAGADQSCLGNAPPPGEAPATTTRTTTKRTRTRTTTRMTRRTTTSRAFDGPCEDKDIHCATSYEQYCYTEHIKNTCPLTCGMCTPQTQTTRPAPPETQTTTPAPPQTQTTTQAPGQVCEDKWSSCAKSFKMYCHTDRIKSACPLTC